MFALSFRLGSRKRPLWGFFVFAFLLILLASQAEVRAQGGTGRQPVKTPTPTPAPSPKKYGGIGNGNSTKRDPAPVKVAVLAINLAYGSRVWLNHIEVELRNSDRPVTLGKQKITTTYSPDQGILMVSGLKPGLCDITVRKTDHREFMQTLDLIADRNNAITVHLTPIPG